MDENEKASVESTVRDIHRNTRKKYSAVYVVQEQLNAFPICISLELGCLAGCYR
jgi:hypothetical protein